MFRFRPKAGHVSVALDGWSTDPSSPNVRYDADGMAFSVDFFALPPDIGASLTNISGLQRFYRDALVRNGVALIECDVIAISGFIGVRVVAKAALEPRGFAFLGSVTVPFRDCSYVLKFQAAEGQPTGLREAMVMMEVMDVGDINVDDESGRISGWCADPYDPDLEYQPMRNQADAVHWDAKFPGHPLSRVRAALDDLPSRASFARRLKGLPKFE